MPPFFLTAFLNLNVASAFFLARESYPGRIQLGADHTDRKRPVELPTPGPSRRRDHSPLLAGTLDDYSPPSASSPPSSSSPSDRRSWPLNPVTDLTLPGRHVTIVTTAALPWFTGTSINPLLRAAQMAKLGLEVTLVLPWLDPTDPFGQGRVFPAGTRFSTPQEQETAVRDWLGGTCDVDNPEPECDPHSFEIAWYPARYHPKLGSIFFDPKAAAEAAHVQPHEQMRSNAVDVLDCLPPQCCDLAILEEPEHLNWHHIGKRWSDRFSWVVGIGHTNYLQYCLDDTGGWYKKPFMRFSNSVVFGAYCDAVVHLSATLRDAGAPDDRTKVCNVHGVRNEFISVGLDRSEAEVRVRQARAGVDRLATSTETATSLLAREEAEAELSRAEAAAGRGVYFLGKKLWTKGYRELLDLVGSQEVSDAVRLGKMRSSGLASTVSNLDPAQPAPSLVVDLIGSGPDEVAMEEAWELSGGNGWDGVHLRFKPAADHKGPSMHGYHVFVNPSVSDVLCTATAEALAMGKIVAIARHPSNEFFYAFANCLTFEPGDALEFASALSAATNQAPLPLTPEERHALTWAAATERLVATIAEPLPATAPLATAPAKAVAAGEEAGEEVVGENQHRPRQSQLQLSPRPRRPSTSAYAAACFLLHQTLMSGPLIGPLVRTLSGTIPEVEFKSLPLLQASPSSPPLSLLEKGSANNLASPNLENKAITLLDGPSTAAAVLAFCGSLLLSTATTTTATMTTAASGPAGEANFAESRQAGGGKARILLANIRARAQEQRLQYQQQLQLRQQSNPFSTKHPRQHWPLEEYDTVGEDEEEGSDGLSQGGASFQPHFGDRPRKRLREVGGWPGAV